LLEVAPRVRQLGDVFEQVRVGHITILVPKHPPICLQRLGALRRQSLAEGRHACALPCYAQ
jgi:hypothetical protein